MNYTEMNYTEINLRAAYLQALNSPDPSSQNGAIVTDFSGRLIGAGWNDFPANVKHTPERWERPTKYEYVVHAEVAAILSAFLGGDQPHTLWCCIPACTNCAKHLIASGVQRVVGHAQLERAYAEQQPQWSEPRRLGIGMLEEAGVQVEWYDEPIPEADPIRVAGQLFDPTA